MSIDIGFKVHMNLLLFLRISQFPAACKKKKKGQETGPIWTGALSDSGSWLFESAEQDQLSGSDAASIGSLNREAWMNFRVWLYQRQRIVGIISSLNKQQVGIPFQGGTGWPHDPSPTVRKLLLAQLLGNKGRFMFCENCSLRFLVWFCFGFFLRDFCWLRKIKNVSNYALFGNIRYFYIFNKFKN